MTKSRIFVVDDHPIVVQGLTQLINQEEDLEICGHAGDGVSAMKAVDGAKPDLVITDISLPGIDGLELVKNLKAKYPRIPILVLSMFDENIYARRALRAGALGYIMKDKVAQDLVTAIKTALRGKISLSSNISSHIIQEYVFQGNNDALPSIEHLTDRELEVFHQIGKGKSTREIAEGLHLSTKTIETYRSKIKEKLRLENSSQLVQRAVHWVQSTGEI